MKHRVVTPYSVISFWLFPVIAVVAGVGEGALIREPGTSLSGAVWHFAASVISAYWRLNSYLA